MCIIVISVTDKYMVIVLSPILIILGLGTTVLSKHLRPFKYLLDGLCHFHNLYGVTLPFLCGILLRSCLGKELFLVTNFRVNQNLST